MSKVKNRRKRKKSVAKHVSSLTMPQQNRLMGLVKELHAASPKKRKRRSRRKNPETERISGFTVSERISPRVERKQSLFDALKTDEQYRQIDELDELEQLKLTSEVQADNRLMSEIENRIDEIKEELPASILLTMTDTNLRNNLKTLRTRESKMAAKKYSRRRLLSSREKTRAFLAAIIVLGFTPFQVQRSRMYSSSTRGSGLGAILSKEDNQMLQMVANQFGVPHPPPPRPNSNGLDWENWAKTISQAIPISLRELHVSLGQEDLLVGPESAIPGYSPSAYQYGGEIADAVLLALPPESIREAREKLDELVEPNMISSIATVSYVSRIKRAKHRLDSLMGTGRIVNTAKHFARRALNPMGRAKNPSGAGDLVRNSLDENAGYMGTMLSAAIGGTIGYLGTGAIRTLLDMLLSSLLADQKARAWVSAIASPILTGGLAAWCSGQMGIGNAQQAVAFAVAGSGARSAHDIGDLALPPKDGTYRYLREAVGLSGYPALQSNHTSNLHGYQYNSPVVAGFMQSAMQGNPYQAPVVTGANSTAVGYPPLM